jgi:hypothetical protein
LTLDADPGLGFQIWIRIPAKNIPVPYCTRLLWLQIPIPFTEYRVLPVPVVSYKGTVLVIVSIITKGNKS